MFWKTDLLVKSGGDFTLIWMLAHNKVSKKIPLGAALLELDIGEKCQALLKYQPTGRLSAEEVRNKMSLYLLAVLQHGIVIAFSKKTDIVIRKLNEALKIFNPIQQAKVKKRKSEIDGNKAKRARRNTAAALQTIEEDAEDEQLIDLRNLPAEPISDRHRVQDVRQITLTEYNQQPQGFFEPDIRDLENMLRFDADQRLEMPRGGSMIAGSRPESRAASVHEDMQSLFVELTQGMDMDLIALDPLQRHLNLNAGTFRSSYLDPVLAEQPMEMMEVDQQQLPNELAVLDPSLRLPALEERVEALNNMLEEQANRPAVKATPKRRRRVQSLIVDKQIELTDAQMRSNLDSTRDIRSKRHPPAQVTKRPTATELLGPTLHYLPYRLDKPYERPAAEDPREGPMAEPLIEFPLPEIDFQEPIVAELARRSSNLPLNNRISTPARDAVPMDFDQPPQFNQTRLYDPSFEEPTQQGGQGLLELPLPDANLLERINVSKRGREQTEFMQFANKATKTTVVRDFVNMLHLLKRRVIKVEQNVSYGPIIVKTV